VNFVAESYLFNSYSELINDEFKMKPISNFIDTYKTFYPYEPDIARKSFLNICNRGRFINHELFMIWFPDYFFVYKNTLDNIIENKEGFLPLSWKLYLGIMAASTIRNEFLLRNLEEEYLLNGGDEDWLIYGLDGAPEKLKKLEIINNILAHQPWKLKIQDIQEVCNFNSINCWNIEDLVQSVIVLTTFHRLATVLESLKFNIKKVEEKENIPNENDKLINMDDIGNNIEIKENYENEEGIKNKILNELEIMNNSDDLPTIKNKDSSDDIATVNTKMIFPHYLNEYGMEYSKYISKYCTLYLDFDSYSEKLFSHFVIIYYYIDEPFFTFLLVNINKLK